MKKSIFYIIIFLSLFYTSNGQVSEYFKDYKSTGKWDFNYITSIIKKVPANELILELNPFYTDSVKRVSVNAYYITYLKGLSCNVSDQQLVVSILTKSLLSNIPLSDKNINLGYLKEFGKLSFTKESKEELLQLLKSSDRINKKSLYLLCGRIGIGKEELQKISYTKLSDEDMWYLYLSLSRLGDSISIRKCMSFADKYPQGDDMVNYLLPDLLYTRNVEAIKFCINIINSDKKNCLSSNPDYEVNILCGYRAMELLAPILKGFPYSIDESGTLNTTNYKEALIKVREWLKNIDDIESLIIK